MIRYHSRNYTQTKRQLCEILSLIQLHTNKQNDTQFRHTASYTITHPHTTRIHIPLGSVDI